jgi:DnaJ-class molecular chaperone
MNYRDIIEAKQTLNLPEQATLEQIRINYRSLLRRYHPDLCREDPAVCVAKTQAIVAAYQIILDYCQQYHFSFSEEDLRRYCSSEDWWFARFGNDPSWRK